MLAYLTSNSSFCLAGFAAARPGTNAPSRDTATASRNPPIMFLLSLLFIVVLRICIMNLMDLVSRTDMLPFRGPTLQVQQDMIDQQSEKTEGDYWRIQLRTFEGLLGVVNQKTKPRIRSDHFGSVLH